MQGKRMTIISLYGPNEDRPMFYENISKIIEDFGNLTVLACGDWNVVHDLHKDTVNYTRLNNPNSRLKMLELQQKFSMVDPWRQWHSEKSKFTWFRKHPYKAGRLDSIVTLSLNLSKECPGRGHWKMNNSLLKNKDYVTRIENSFREVIYRYSADANIPENQIYSWENFTISYSTLFEMIQNEVRNQTIAFSVSLKKDMDKREKDLLTKIEETKEIIDDIYEEDLLIKYEELKRQLEVLRKQKWRESC